MEVSGAIALVTGANGGLGKYFVEGLKAQGAAKIYAGARKVEALKELVATDPERIIPIQLEITDEESVRQAASKCQDVNLLINNAGVGLNKGLIAAPDLSSARAEMEVNYFGTLIMCRAFAPILKQNGGGAIANMVSMVARVNLPFNGSYGASKAAVLSMTQAIRAELAAQKTLVVAVLPGAIDIGMGKSFPDPKVPPQEVVRDTLQAVIDGTEDVYPGEQAKQLNQQLLQDPKAVEKMIATFLPD
ncbi:short-chain dehydrogenase [Nostoc linckia z18]|jgi:NAD(P)-dependent dehydrogenase (short-subunit alcohol dehydrogenase family)|uniref:Short-chain dehydrogenase n=2 Tax=Nostoc linckia TaxID=92942 RepID=A0A9Q6EMZ8_NOSLI|nr:SDR family oxidoreductase [Nostoc linckia]PHK41326.1 short-chain dehydrogenase [Nostoc linckia z15]PHK47512.1 short-chain dehydrogenase [Nostoc linckia z16]PHJ68575.1 short-chain dehydrogenase [Nostoc linckia z1]PHJ70748.1 short-chain dehydrogenase [Nostoc linckia z3]PHJ76182.1 short-chain dehydrogenase [Nostoc linckia z2]